MSELDRFNFVQARDGTAAANAWALRTYRVYRAWVYSKKSNFTQLPTWRPLFLRSLVELRRINETQ